MEDVVNVVDVHTMCILRNSLCFKQLCENLLAKGVKQGVDFILTCAFGSSEILLIT